jgi:serine/threonine protein phosphatase 1
MVEPISQVLDYLIELNTTNNCVFIRGKPWWIIIALVKRQQRQSYVVQARRSNCTCLWKKSIPTNNYMLTFTVKDYYLDEKNRLLFTRIYQPWRYLWILSKVILLGQNLWETALSLDQRIKPNDLLYPNDNVVWRNLYRPYPCNAHYETEPVQKACIWNIDTGAAFKGPLSILDVDTKSAGRGALSHFVFWRKGRN